MTTDDTTTNGRSIIDLIEAREPDADWETIDLVPPVLEQFEQSGLDQYVCPICDKHPFSPSGIWIHVSAHIAAALGAAFRSEPGTNIANTMITCPICSGDYVHKNIGLHLTKRHDVNTRDALVFKLSAAKRTREERPKRDILPPHPEPIADGGPVRQAPPRPDEPQSPINGIEPTDAALAVLMGVGRDGHIRVADLPAVIEYIKHTEHVLGLIEQPH